MRIQMRPGLVLPAMLAMATSLLGADCRPGPPAYQEPGHPLFLGPQTRPIALSGDGLRLYVVHTTAGVLTVLDLSSPGLPVLAAEIPVGVEPVGVAVRPKLVPDDPNEDELVFVANHVSDSISVVSRAQLAVVQTLGERDADGVSLTDEPVGVAFAGPSRGFVTLDHPNQVAVIDVDPAGRASLSPVRLPITAQAPRALAAGGGRLFVAAFESGNQTEFPTCAPGDPRGLDPLHPVDMGCEFTYDFAAVTTLNTVNRGGRVIRDGDVPDRDLFVFDATTLAPIEVLEGVGTLLYGVAATTSGQRVYVAHTEARNDRNGLLELAGRMFDNRLAVIDCLPGCTTTQTIDLDAAAGMPVPTPYGVAVSEDGATVLVTAAGSDVTPGIPSSPGTTLPGLLVLDASGTVLSSLPLGAMPHGVALRSATGGAADRAYVLNSFDASVSVIDLADPSAPSVTATLALGGEPLPEAVRRGRIAFHAARASSSGTFSCASCHPNGNVDQLLWTINTLAHPDDGPDAAGVVADPRQTMPIRGLTRTLPLHWDGSLGDPISGTTIPGDRSPDCDPADPKTCFRHLVDASLSGVMCDPNGCATGPSGLPGALGASLRDDMAEFLRSVSHPPPPAARMDGSLSPEALEGARDFLTADNGLGFDPDYTCGQPGGCHDLPLYAGTNNPNGGGDAPSFRGLWDRFLIFSSGFPSSEEVLTLVQDCADGIGPVSVCGDVPAMGGATFDEVYDPAVGMTERGSLMVAVHSFDRLFTGMRGPELWAFTSELGVGLPAPTGRQVSLEPATAGDAATTAALDGLEAFARAKRLVLLVRGTPAGSAAFAPSNGLWKSLAGPDTWSTAELLTMAAGGAVLTVTAWPARDVGPDGGAQPVVWPDPPADALGNANLPRPPAGGTAQIQLARSGVLANAEVVIDGALCTSCDLTLAVSPQGIPLVDVWIDPVPGAGPHMLQVINPNGLESNQLLFVAE